MWIPIFFIFGFIENFYLATGSTLTKPPQSALVVAFERYYEQSLLAYTLSDQNIDTTLLISGSNPENLYENLRDVEIIKLNASSDKQADKAALNACQILLSNENILKRVREIQPTFVIFPAIRHDACILPWIEFINSIPVIVTYDPEEEVYAVQRTQVALPIHTGGLLSGFWLNVYLHMNVGNNDFVGPALKLAKQHLSLKDTFTMESLYSRVQLILSSSDPILRTSFARLNEQPIEIGCHHCRGGHPLPAPLQKELVEFRQGTIVVTLDDSYASFVADVARKLPQGRQGLSVAWKSYKAQIPEEKPENLFVHGEVDRQDLIGYGRSRVLLSHCEETELLESIFHGTPVICFPRSANEHKNAERAVELNLGVIMDKDVTIETASSVIEKVHKTTSYRETARGYSSLIRDRPLPASDRIIHWLGYVARNADRQIKLPVLRANDVRTFTGDSQTLSGFLFGMICGSLFVIVAILSYKNKNVYRMPRKDRKFNR